MINNEELELTILMPCLNEEETLETCIVKAKKYLVDSNINGEILIADNGSTDRSIAVAENNSVRVVHVKNKGYGSALMAGIQSASGKFIIMGDADDSYDFSQLDRFIDSLRTGNELVMGNRFKGGISPNAMPPLHKYIGNPILSFLGKLFFKIPCGDFHCGLRGFNRESILALNLHTTGMEFASEMVVRSSIAQLSIDEVPTTLSPDGRTRAPHLNTWRDGWRHLCFLLMYTPKWLFLYPAIMLFLFGLITTICLFGGPMTISDIEFADKTFYAGALSLLISVQCLSLGSIVRKYATEQNFLPSPKYNNLLNKITLENAAFFAFSVIIIGLTLSFWCFYKWAAVDFGELDSHYINRTMVLSLTLIACGIQSFCTAFVSGIISIKKTYL
ncbi:glycosyltransferase family 2 protein [Vibrio neonatus]|uniref:glycosyltransferase family 2 protein n=1 Tax=Vibrio neonatus TaxID=278860 RepID=UPI0021C4A6D8|nr:glycosyltransferase family 2 protein [Vibrio neonatus]